MILVKQRTDTFGALASTLCLIHCAATPILFIAQTCTQTCCQSAPLWWQFIDYLFLAISFVAIYKTNQKTSCTWIKPSLWLSWITLLIVIINEKIEWLPLNHNLIYVPAMALIILHLCNRRYCQCNKGKCCTNEK